MENSLTPVDEKQFDAGVDGLLHFTAKKVLRLLAAAFF